MSARRGIRGHLVSRLAALLGVLCAFGVGEARAGTGLMPVPVLGDVQVQAGVTGNLEDRYTYAFTVGNPAVSTGQIWLVAVDASATSSEAERFDGSGLTIPVGATVRSFHEALARAQALMPVGLGVVPVGQRVPDGWSGGLNAGGFAVFGSLSEAAQIRPGQTRGGFELVSPGVPALRTMIIDPFWVFVAPDDDLSPEDERDAEDVYLRKQVQRITLAPSGVEPGSFAHWDQLRDDLARAIDLGWVPGTTLAGTLTTQLAAARQALEAGDGTLAKQRLGTLIQTVAQSDPTQRRPEVADLVRLNAEALILRTGDTPIPFEPRAIISPETATLAIGETFTVTVRIVNAADGDRPVPDFELSLRVVTGPHAGENAFGHTDANGIFAFAYSGSEVGTDLILVFQPGEVFIDLGELTVTWTGGPDLVVPLFIPPLIESAGGRTVFVQDQTANIGSLPAPASITRYFLSDASPVDPATARVLGERAVPPLGPDEESDGERLTLTLPPDLPPGTYYLDACADGAGAIAELSEANNCASSQLDRPSIVVPIRSTGSQPVVCDNAYPSVVTLWPPNHQLVPIEILGVIDATTVRITGITQDEPVNGLGDGDTSPDGFGVGTARAELRAERGGGRNGRVYAVAFEAENGTGGSCTGTVRVEVPHDQGRKGAAVDDGQAYDATQP